MKTIFNFDPDRERVPSAPAGAGEGAASPPPGRAERTLALCDLAPGMHARVVAVDASVAAGRRLLDLGFLPGTAVHVLRRAPLGDPVVYELRGSRVCLRRTDAARVRVQMLPAAGGHPPTPT